MQPNLNSYLSGVAELVTFAPQATNEHAQWLAEMRVRLDLIHLKHAFPDNHPRVKDYAAIKIQAKRQGMLWDPAPRARTQATEGKQISFASRSLEAAKKHIAQEERKRQAVCKGAPARYNQLRAAAKKAGWKF